MINLNCHSDPGLAPGEESHFRQETDKILHFVQDDRQTMSFWDAL
jgi:hypothetical protein